MRTWKILNNNNNRVYTPLSERCSQSRVFISGAYAGFLRGGGPTSKFLGIWIYMTRSGMSRAAKLRAFVRGVWGHAPQENF